MNWERLFVNTLLVVTALVILSGLFIPRPEPVQWHQQCLYDQFGNGPLNICERRYFDL